MTVLCVNTQRQEPCCSVAFLKVSLIGAENKGGTRLVCAVNKPCPGSPHSSAASCARCPSSATIPLERVRGVRPAEGASSLPGFTPTGTHLLSARIADAGCQIAAAIGGEDRSLGTRRTIPGCKLPECAISGCTIPGRTLKVVFDTNVLVYAEGVNGVSMIKVALALADRLPQESVVLPVQVLSELFRLLVPNKAGRRPSEAGSACPRLACGWPAVGLMHLLSLRLRLNSCWPPPTSQSTSSVSGIERFSALLAKQRAGYVCQRRGRMDLSRRASRSFTPTRDPGIGCWSHC